MNQDKKENKKEPVSQKPEKAEPEAKMPAGNADAEQSGASQCADNPSERGAETDSAGELLKQLATAQTEAARNKDLYLRSVADLDNYRKKVQRQNEELAKYALQPLVEELLPSIDHLEMAIDASKTASESKNLILGVEMVKNQILKVFEGFGVTEIKMHGKEFDPKTEECVAHEPSSEVAENKIIKVVRKGYMYNGRLLRAASVVVSSGKPDGK